MKNTLISKSRFYNLVAFTLVIIYLIPYVILGENARITAWDNLDSVFVWYKILINEGLVFKSNNTPVNIMMGGIPRGSLPGELHFTTLLYWLLGPLPSYITERFIVHITAFVGMLLLLNKHILVNKTYPEWLVPGVSLCFALLPFWPYGGLSSAGLPLLFYAFLNFRANLHTKWDWLIIFVFAFYSSLVFVGVFVILLLGIILIRDAYHTKKINSGSFYFITLLGILYVISSYRLFQSFVLSTGYVSHRVEFQYLKSKGILSALSSAYSFILNGQGHAISLTFPYVLLMVSIGTIIALIAKYPVKKIVYLLSCILITSLIYGFKDSTLLSEVDKIIKSKIPIQYDRFYIITPALWYILMAISGYYILKHFKFGQYIVIPLIVLQIIVSFKKSEIIHNEIQHRFYEPETPTFKEFFAEEQFNQIKQKIAKPMDSYRVASLGIHPSISQYNGFYTIDGYCADYPLEYKHKFRKVIAKELNKNEKLRKSFDYWGSRAYLLTEQDFGQLTNKANARSAEFNNLEFDVQALDNLNCKYIISAIKVNEQTSKGLKLVQIFEDKNSAWDIWLYKVEPAGESKNLIQVNN